MREYASEVQLWVSQLCLESKQSPHQMARDVDAI